MMIVAFGFGLWFCLVMALGAAFKWKLHARLGAVLTLPAIACVVCAYLL